nr:hypothetical protein CFP56_35342 [Quercus suber]
MKPEEKATSASVLPNTAPYPSVRTLDDLPPGFGGQPNTKHSFSYTSHTSEAEQEKDVPSQSHPWQRSRAQRNRLLWTRFLRKILPSPRVAMGPNWGPFSFLPGSPFSTF